MGDEARAVRGSDQLLDQRVDRRALDPQQVAAARLVGGMRPPEFALLVAGRQRLRKQDDGHVEIKGIHAPLVLRGVDGAHPGGDAEPLQVLDDR